MSERYTMPELPEGQYWRVEGDFFYDARVSIFERGGEGEHDRLVKSQTVPNTTVWVHAAAMAICSQQDSLIRQPGYGRYEGGEELR